MKFKKIIFIILAIATAGGFIYGGYRIANKKLDVSGGIVCAQEALLCPNGLYVGRSGFECKFSACPNQDSFTGILRKINGSFSLLFGAPEVSSSGEVSYLMPLVISDNDVAEKLVGQKVRVFGTFTEGIIFSVNRFEKLSGDAGDPTLGEVSIGQSVFINGVRITLNKIVQDSRCPADVQCIQAGSVTVNVTLQSDTDKETTDISSVANPIAFDSYKISVKNVSPSRIAGSILEPGKYAVVFNVQSN